MLLCFFCACEECLDLAKELVSWPGNLRGVEMVVVSFFSPSQAAGFQRDTGLRARYLFDAFGDLAARYQATSCPRLVLVNRYGTVAYMSRVPPQEPNSLLAELTQCLHEG